MRFPHPIKIAPNSTRFRLSDLERFEAECAGEQPPPQRSAADERYLTVQQVAERYSASRPTIWRWINEAGNRKVVA